MIFRSKHLSKFILVKAILYATFHFFQSVLGMKMAFPENTCVKLLYLRAPKPKLKFQNLLFSIILICNVIVVSVTCLSKVMETEFSFSLIRLRKTHKILKSSMNSVLN